MQYRYYFTTHRRTAGSEEFDNFFEAVQYMNTHTDSTYGIITAEIVDMNSKQVVCSRRIIK